MGSFPARGFRDRVEAGRAVAERLSDRRGGNALVLGLARGGVPVAREVADLLGLELDVFVVRKVGVPRQPELALGAVASGGVRVRNEPVLERARLDPELVMELFEREAEEVERREWAYRDGRPAAEVRGREAILVDDGLATGASMRAAIEALRERGAGKVTVAVPVAPTETRQELEPEVDEIVCVAEPRPFIAVGAWYENFAQVDDEQVRSLLVRWRSGT